MLRKIFIGFILLLVALTAVIASRPDEFHVSRGTVISAAPETVFPLVNDLHNWEAWSPWAKIDPNAKMTYSGSAAGTGASCAWAGNHEIGEGSMTITESRMNERIRMKLDFLKPFKGTNDVEFTFIPQGRQTAVTWTMTGKNNFLSKAIGLVMNCEKMVGDQYEKGLAQMKSAAESR